MWVALHKQKLTWTENKRKQPSERKESNNINLD